MALTKLDPRTALIVIDLQNGIVSLPAAHPIEGVVAKTLELIEAFRRRGLPVVLVNAAGVAPGRTERSRSLGTLPDGWVDLIQELNVQPGDHLITKRTWGAFTGTALDATLRKLEVTQVVIAGVATSIGVESTAREAYALGFNVTLATDAMTDLDADAHANSIARIFPRLGETGTAEAIIDLLEEAA
jgi:nicotinamidase-related amidase